MRKETVNISGIKTRFKEIKKYAGKESPIGKRKIPFPKKSENKKFRKKNRICVNFSSCEKTSTANITLIPHNFTCLLIHQCMLKYNGEWWYSIEKRFHDKIIYFIVHHMLKHIEVYVYMHLSIYLSSIDSFNCRDILTELYRESTLTRLINKFPDIFRMGTFIDSKHMKLQSSSK